MTLPWRKDAIPLMLAPMQGITNRELRNAFAKTAPPDVFFTEFVRVGARGRPLIADVDFVEALSAPDHIPLVVQVIGSLDDGVVQATRALVERGVEHINVNMGCPFGRMTSVLAGGGMFREPDLVQPLLSALRSLVPGSLSVKTRLGLEQPDELLALLPAFENAGVDFLAVHARTVAQKYKGIAEHTRTAEVVRATALPVIANGDLVDAAGVQSVLKQTGAHGVMIGRGALNDPLLFARLRTQAPARPTGWQRQREIADFLAAVLTSYRDLFCGDAQVVAKMREILCHVQDEEWKRWLKKLRKQKQVRGILELLDEVQAGPL